MALGGAGDIPPYFSGPIMPPSAKIYGGGELIPPAGGGPPAPGPAAPAPFSTYAGNFSNGYTVNNAALNDWKIPDQYANSDWAKEFNSIADPSQRWAYGLRMGSPQQTQMLRNMLTDQYNSSGGAQGLSKEQATAFADLMSGNVAGHGDLYDSWRKNLGLSGDYSGFHGTLGNETQGLYGNNDPTQQSYYGALNPDGSVDTTRMSPWAQASNNLQISGNNAANAFMSANPNSYYDVNGKLVGGTPPPGTTTNPPPVDTSSGSGSGFDPYRTTAPISNRDAYTHQMPTNITRNDTGPVVGSATTGTGFDPYSRSNVSTRTPGSGFAPYSRGGGAARVSPWNDNGGPFGRNA